jgi:hypothetical protein
VDIVVVQQMEKEAVTQVVLTGMLILAIDPKAENNLTVQVTPEEGVRLALAAQLGELRFSPQPTVGKK